MAGSVVNISSKTLWVVETDTGSAIAHKLAPNRKSPSTVDADGVKAVDGTPISGLIKDDHMSWWKVTGVSNANITDANGKLHNDCLACFPVEENEFGPVVFKNEDGWGERI